MTILNQGTDEPIVAVAAVDGTVNLRRLIKNPSGRLEIQRELIFEEQLLQT